MLRRIDVTVQSLVSSSSLLDTFTDNINVRKFFYRLAPFLNDLDFYTNRKVYRYCEKVKIAHTRLPSEGSGADPGTWQSACR